MKRLSSHRPHPGAARTAALGALLASLLVALTLAWAPSYARADEAEPLADGAPDAAQLSSELAAAAATRLPNDTRSSELYYLQPWIDYRLHLNDGFDLESAQLGAGVLDAWNLFRSNGRVTVAVIDTGCQANHPDLKANIDRQHMKDVYSDTAPGFMWDYSGHGTHVCGIIGASADNDLGVAGASYNAKVLPIKVFNNDTVNPGARTSDIIKAYQYLDDLMDKGELQDLRVVNMSLGGYGYSAEDALLEKEIESLRSEHDVLTVAAGGNGDSRTDQPYTAKSYPSDYDCVFSVTSLAPNGDDSAWSDYNECKDISAPGEDILSTYGSGYARLSGTSMASPLVAGIAGLLYAADPTLTPDAVEDILQETAGAMRMTTNHGRRISPQYNPGGMTTGSPGAVNAEAALRKVLTERLGITQFIEPGDVEIVGATTIMYDDDRPIEPPVKVTHEGVELREGEDYEVSYSCNIRPGHGVATVTGTGAWGGCVSVDFVVDIDDAHRKDINDFEITGPDGAEFTYNGGAFEPVVTITRDGRELVPEEDYDLEYRDNVDAGEASVTVRGKSIYKGERTFRFTILQAPCTIHLDDKVYYTRVGMDPMEVHIFGPNAMDYKVATTNADCADVEIIHFYQNQAKFYYNAVKITPKAKGEAEVTLSGTSKNYITPEDLTFKLSIQGEDEGILPNTKDIARATFHVQDDLVYNGEVQWPTYTVTMGDESLEAGKHYHGSFSYEAGAGRHTFFVNGNSTGGYSGTAHVAYEIAKATPEVRIAESDLAFASGAAAARTVGVSVGSVGANAEKAQLASVDTTDETVATVELVDGQLKVTPVGEGRAIIRAMTAETENLNAGSDVLAVTVGAPDGGESEPGTGGGGTSEPVTPPSPGSGDSGDSGSGDAGSGGSTPVTPPSPVMPPNPGGTGGDGGDGGSTTPSEATDAQKIADEAVSSEALTGVNKDAGSVATVTAEAAPAAGSAGGGDVTWTVAIAEADAATSEVSEGPVRGIVRAIKGAQAVRAELVGASSISIDFSKATDQQIEEFCQKCVDATLAKAARTMAASSHTAGELDASSFQLKVTGADGSTAIHTVRFKAAGSGSGGAGSTDDIVPIYRLYNDDTQEHLLTGSSNETRTLARDPKRHWTYEGIAMWVPRTGTTRVWRLYDLNTGEHLYTALDSEVSSLLAKGHWTRDDASSGWATADKPGITVHRLYKWSPDPRGSHHITSDANEIRVLTTERGYSLDDMTFYAVKDGDPKAPLP